MQQTIDAVIAAGAFPISIIIVGVGGEDFSDMRVLDAGKHTDYECACPQCPQMSDAKQMTVTSCALMGPLESGTLCNSWR
jgi:hypothetical protein